MFICGPAACVATKSGVMHRYTKDTILKKLFPPVLLRICVSVCELKKSQPKAARPSSGVVDVRCDSPHKQLDDSSLIDDFLNVVI
jgi:hypothetical protein